MRWCHLGSLLCHPIVPIRDDANALHVLYHNFRHCLVSINFTHQLQTSRCIDRSQPSIFDACRSPFVPCTTRHQARSAHSFAFSLRHSSPCVASLRSDHRARTAQELACDFAPPALRLASEAAQEPLGPRLLSHIRPLFAASQCTQSVPFCLCPGSFATVQRAYYHRTRDAECVSP